MVDHAPRLDVLHGHRLLCSWFLGSIDLRCDVYVPADKTYSRWDETVQVDVTDRALKVKGKLPCEDASSQPLRVVSPTHDQTNEDSSACLRYGGHGLPTIA